MTTDFSRGGKAWTFFNFRFLGLGRATLVASFFLTTLIARAREDSLLLADWNSRFMLSVQDQNAEDRRLPAGLVCVSGIKTLKLIW